jgi:phosphoribosylformylglycinamidine synthase
MTFGYNPVLMSRSPYEGAKGSIREALAKFACLGGDPFRARLSLQEYFARPLSPESWGSPAAALLGALEAQLRLGIPAIGGKDSMSGNYRGKAAGNGTSPDRDGELNLAVPPTLAAFAAGTVPADQIRSGALSGKPGNIVILLCGSGKFRTKGPAPETETEDEWEDFKANMETLKELAAGGGLRAAYPVGPGGVAAALAVMAFGNMTGVEARAPAFDLVDENTCQGPVLAEIDGDALPREGGGDRWIIAALTLDTKVFRIVREPPEGVSGLRDEEAPESLTAEVPLEVLRRAYEYPLSQVYPQTSSGATAAEVPEAGGTLQVPPFKAVPAGPSSRAAFRNRPAGIPLVVLPVFPGTNCEWDMERAFREAGGRTRLIVFRNRTREDIGESLKKMAAAFAEAQIIALPGGFSAGDEPDGSGKFIANVLRSPAIAAAITDFLDKRGGLMLGICNGFQALIKTGLLPYGRILPAEDAMPTLAFNTIGRHVSRMVRTRVMPNNSPWLSLDEPGSVHVIPVSHGEGRLVVRPEEAESLFAAGQVPFCYADAGGRPTLAEPDNPNGSAFAIEGLTSPGGRILGKMGHSERCGQFVHINIPGNKRQRICEAGIAWFRRS